MNIDEYILEIISGDADLRKIIDYYSNAGNSSDFIYYLNDGAALTSILYILAELPKNDDVVVRRVKKLISSAELSDEARYWAQQIVDNH